MQRRKDVAVDFEDRENFGYAIGEASDWVSRSVIDITDWVEDMRAGKMTLRLKIQQRFREAQDNLNDWQKWWGWKAEEAGLPYVHPSLKIARVVLPLPTETA